MASVSKSANGLTRILFKNTNGKRETISLGKISKKNADRVKIFIENLLSYKTTNQPFDDATNAWVSGLPRPLQLKLQKKGLIKQAYVLRLGDFLRNFVLTKLSVQNSTKEIWGHTIRELISFFGDEKLLLEITIGQAEDFKDKLLSKGLASTTVEKRLSFARQFFNCAVKHGFLLSNPFTGISHSGGDDIKARQMYIPADMIVHMLGLANRDLKIIIALCRFGGLRCPTEVLSLKWEDINWYKHEVKVISPKTQRYKGKGSRVIPIFKELRPYLLEAKDTALPGQTHVVGGNYLKKEKGDEIWRNINLRKPFEKLIIQAGCTLWPKMFHNLRASCETDQLDNHPLHVVADWFGHSVEVAKAHYALKKDVHFWRAAGIQLNEESRIHLDAFKISHFPVWPTQIPTQQAPAILSTEQQQKGLSLYLVPTYAEVCRTMQNVAKPVKAEEGAFENPGFSPEKPTFLSRLRRIQRTLRVSPKPNGHQPFRHLRERLPELKSKASSFKAQRKTNRNKGISRLAPVNSTVRLLILIKNLPAQTRLAFIHLLEAQALVGGLSTNQRMV